MSDLSAKTLGALVVDTPAAARVFEQQGLDYCCGGGQTLSEACTSAGVGLSDVLEELAGLDSQDAETPSIPTGVAELVDHIEREHHSYLNREMPRLAALAAKVEGVHGERHPEVKEVRSLVDEVRADLEPHMFKEENVLFPMIRELDASTTHIDFHCGTLSNPISCMMMEHDQVGELLLRLRAAAQDYEPPSDACTSYRLLYASLAELEADTHLHIHKENNLLFPAVIALEASTAPAGS